MEMGSQEDKARRQYSRDARWPGLEEHGPIHLDLLRSRATIRRMLRPARNEWDAEQEVRWKCRSKTRRGCLGGNETETKQEGGKKPAGKCK